MPKPSTPSVFDPYAGNVLVQSMGPILSRAEVSKRLLVMPPRPPTNIQSIPREVRMHMVMMIRDLHIPQLEELRLHESTDLMMRQNYRYLEPASPKTWGLISGESSQITRRSWAPAFGAAVEGISGSGKSVAIHNCLSLYPQVVRHKTFFRMVDGLTQVIWLSAEVPPSGRAPDLAVALMNALMRATGNTRFEKAIAGNWRNGMQMLEEWRQVATAHFLGILHLDEVQNFFKIGTLESRRKRKAGEYAPELSIVEDQCLKWILSLMNTWQIPLLVSGTPDGIGALTKRLSNTQRIVTSGYHPFKHFTEVDDPAFRKVLLPQLGVYQYVKTPLPTDDALAGLIMETTAGVPRLIIALWITAHRVALERTSDDLRLSDFRKAADTYLSPVGPAVAALRSNDPLRMARYEDLVPKDHTFWTQFWGNVGGAP